MVKTPLVVRDQIGKSMGRPFWWIFVLETVVNKSGEGEKVKQFRFQLVPSKTSLILVEESLAEGGPVTRFLRLPIFGIQLASHRLRLEWM